MKYFFVSMFLAIFGESLILASFLYFGENSKELWLNFTVTSIIYCLWFSQRIFPLIKINLKDKSQKEVSSLGIRFFAVILYSLLAIIAMLAFNWQKGAVSFGAQIITQLILLFIFFVFLVWGMNAQRNTEKVYEKEQNLNEGKDNLKSTVSLLRQKLSAKNDFPDWILNRIKNLEEEVRYLSPNGTAQAQTLEKSFVDTLKSLETDLDFGNTEQVKIDELLKRCEITLTERKRTLN
jgi:hypothetical protein